MGVLLCKKESRELIAHVQRPQLLSSSACKWKADQEMLRRCLKPNVGDASQIGLAACNINTSANYMVRLLLQSLVYQLKHHIIPRCFSDTFRPSPGLMVRDESWEMHRG